MTSIYRAATVVRHISVFFMPAKTIGKSRVNVGHIINVCMETFKEGRSHEEVYAEIGLRKMLQKFNFFKEKRG